MADFKTVRLPRELTDRIDEVANGVPRERWVRRVLEAALGEGRAEPFRCPVRGCQSRYDKPGFKCKTHDRELVAS